MTIPKTTIILIFAALTSSCDNTKRIDKELEEQAGHMIQRLDSPTLRFLENWDYGQRGPNNFWSRLLGDSMLFNCSFYLSGDTIKLRTYQADKFLYYFNSTLKVDTTYSEIQFSKITDTTFNLEGCNNHGHDSLLAINLSLNKFFTRQNPFDTLKRLTILKDSLNVIGIRHFNVLSGFVEFYLPSGQHILTYLPDSLLNSINFSKFWKAEFSKGKRIKPDWNFRKLENPMDGG